MVVLVVVMVADERPGTLPPSEEGTAGEGEIEGDNVVPPNDVASREGEGCCATASRVER